MDYSTCSLSSPITPLFYEIKTTYYARVAETEKSVLLYYFDTNSPIITEIDYSNYKLEPIGNSLPPPRGAFMRGKYLDSNFNYYVVNPQLVVSLSPSFLFWLKLEASDYLPILTKNSLYKFCISKSGHFIYADKWINFEDDSLSESTWILAKYQFFYKTAQSITTLKISVNENIRFTYDITGYLYFDDNIFNIGYDDDANYKGWIYLFGYCDSNTNIKLSNVRATGCLYVSEANAKCTINCNMTSYFDDIECKLCPQGNLNCKSITDCGSCYDSTCSTCKYSEASFCSDCTGLIAEAVVKDVDLKEYSFSWKIDNADSSVFLSPINQIKVAIDMTMLVKGKSYKLSFELVDSSKQSFMFS